MSGWIRRAIETISWVAAISRFNRLRTVCFSSSTSLSLDVAPVFTQVNGDATVLQVRQESHGDRSGSTVRSAQVHVGDVVNIHPKTGHDTFSTVLESYSDQPL